MSEYQYYEFRTIHRQLTPAQRSAVSKLSSHGETTSTRFSVDYSYGSFKHKPIEVLAQYFDAFFYIANWGTVHLMFRFPKALVDVRSLDPYCIEGRITIEYQTVAESLILSIECNEEEGYGWVDDTGQLEILLPLYDAILNGDRRALYLAWLGTIGEGVSEYNDEFDEDSVEPPVPPGLGLLSAGLDAFVEIFDISEDLISVAARGSEPSAPSQADSEANIESLPPDEQIDFLRRLLQGEDNLVSKLRLRLRELQPSSVSYEPAGKRTIGELLAAKEQVAQQRKLAAAAAQELKRRARIAELAKKGDAAWQEIEDFINEKTSEGYKKAATLLQQLEELAIDQNQTQLFSSRLERIRNQNSRRSAFLRELQKRNL